MKVWNGTRREMDELGGIWIILKKFDIVIVDGVPIIASGKIPRGADGWGEQSNQACGCLIVWDEGELAELD